MEAPLQEYLEDARICVHGDATLMLLEKEVRRRQIKQARLQRELMKTRATLTSQMSEDERVRFTQELRDHAREVAEKAIKEMQLRWNVGDSSWLLESEEPADVFFDFSAFEKPNVAVSYPSENQPSVVIDIIKSVQRDPKNIGNPLIVAAIERYADRLASASAAKGPRHHLNSQEMPDETANLHGLTPQQAERRLKRIFEQVTTTAKSRARRSAKNLSKWERCLELANPSFGDEYFVSLSGILREKEVKRSEKLSTTWRSKVAIRLHKSMPEIDHKPILDFLAEGRLPRHRTAAALRNGFLASKFKIEPSSLRKYRSADLNYLRSLSEGLPQDYDLSDLIGDEANEKLSNEAMDRFLLNLGVGKIDTYVNVRSSNLVWEEITPVPETST